MPKQYYVGPWHWLIHERNGDPSAPRAIGILLIFLVAVCSLLAQLYGIVDFRALL